LLLLVFDGVDFINVTVFGYHLEPFFGCSANEFEKYVVFCYGAVICRYVQFKCTANKY